MAAIGFLVGSPYFDVRCDLFSSGSVGDEQQPERGADEREPCRDVLMGNLHAFPGKDVCPSDPVLCTEYQRPVYLFDRVLRRIPWVLLFRLVVGRGLARARRIHRRSSLL